MGFNMDFNMDPRIQTYLDDDKIFNKMNKKFISLGQEERKKINEHLNEVLAELIKIMRNQSPLFNKASTRFVYTGSYYKKTKVGLPDEFDLNLIIRLPIKEKDILFEKSLPGYVKIRTNINTDNTHLLNIDQKIYREMMSFIDDQTYLNQDKFRRWIERILNKAAYDTNQDNKIKLTNYIITIKKSGPAFTLVLKIPNRYQINIDLVPVLAFLSNRNPPPCSRNYVEQYCNKEWYLVPKPLNNKNLSDKEQNHLWRLSFYSFESDILSRNGRAKVIIRHLKKFRDTQNWKCIASYYIETLCFHHLYIFQQKRSSTSLFVMMLIRLYEALCNGRIEFYWDEKLNLLEKIGYSELKNIQGRLSRIINNIKKQIIEEPKNPYAIATYVLNRGEMEILKHDISESGLEAKPELDTESQWRCIIV